MSKTIDQMTAEIRENVTSKGFRGADGGPGQRTFGDYVALLHSEISEMLEAYRSHGTKDFTAPAKCCEPTCPRYQLARTAVDCTTLNHPGTVEKPEGFGPELADLMIYLLDMADAWKLKPVGFHLTLSQIEPNRIHLPMSGVGDWVTWLHRLTSAIASARIVETLVAPTMSYLLGAIVEVARAYGIDLEWEYERKMTFNRTRPYRHGWVKM